MEKINNNMFVIKKGYKEQMKTDAVFYINEKLKKNLESDSINQLINVTTLFGIVGPAIAMPDIHKGYGFPIGGVAAFDLDKGIISPGGIGYDINCGVRFLKTFLKKDDIKGKEKEILNSIFHKVPCGVGSEGGIKLGEADYEKVLTMGVRWAIEMGYGSEDEINFIESGGMMQTSTQSVTKKAKERGKYQLGTLGSGNHFIELQMVDEVYDEEISKKWDIVKDQICVMIHTGSRGFGHQIATDYIPIMLRSAQSNGIKLYDKELACAPFKSKEGLDYFSAMKASANFAWANRQIIRKYVEDGLIKALKISPHMLGLKTLYDVAHNIAKIEKHIINGKEIEVIVHRKGATRAFSKGHIELSDFFKQTGHPVIIPGDMGRYSYVAVGLEGAMKNSFGTSCHGAGRVLSRTKALEISKSKEIKDNLLSKGIHIAASSMKTIAQEMPSAYKDVFDVVNVLENLGIIKKVFKLVPICVIKG